MSMRQKLIIRLKHQLANNEFIAFFQDAYVVFIHLS